MKKLILFLLIASGCFAQQNPFLKSDSLDIVVYESYQDSLKKAFDAGGYEDFLQKFGKYYDNNFQFDRFKSLSIDALEMELFDLRNSQRKYLKNTTISEPLKSYLSRENEMQYWHLIYAYPVIRANEDQKLRRFISLPEVIIKDFKKEIFSEQSNLQSYAFRKLIPQWVTYENSRKQNFEKYTNLLLAANDKVEFSLENFKGNIADFSLAQILYFNKPYLSGSLAQNIVSQINNDKIRGLFTGQFLDDVIAESKKREVAKKETPAQNGFEFVDLKGNTFSLSKYKGKIVYLDFWASWCGPCKVQFPHSKRLHEEIPAKLKKKIVFLYISIDDTQEKWKDAVKSNGLEEFEHGYTEGAWGSPVITKLGIRGIPRYMIVDKEGKIVEMNAKRPSSPEILSELIKLAE